MIALLIIFIIISSFFVIFYSNHTLKKAYRIKLDGEKALQQASAITLQKQEQQQKIDKEIQQQEKKKEFLQNQLRRKAKENNNYELRQRERIKSNLDVYSQQINGEKQILYKEYTNYKESLTQQLESIQDNLDKMKKMQAAAQEAIARKQKIKEEKNKYSLQISSIDLDDIKEIGKIKEHLHKPRIINMLIWSNYWQPLAKKQFPLIIGSGQHTGIYKITNQITDECYIGQSTDIYKRFCQHCKCGLGIDTPPGNKLYQSIQEYGLQNFTFEVLVECEKDQLDAQEKYFIQLYNSRDFGFNSTKGNH